MTKKRNRYGSVSDYVSERFGPVEMAPWGTCVSPGVFHWQTPSRERWIVDGAYFKPFPGASSPIGFSLAIGDALFGVFPWVEGEWIAYAERVLIWRFRFTVPLVMPEGYAVKMLFNACDDGEIFKWSALLFGTKERLV
jgi:hypothetical protein